ncbi:MAG: CoA pyrophosphatase [Deltaproteobacteria bacterium]|jgi:8-oxo-dGTP pyrophosphatase MutT (NUDIX family)|nr:CoA pyrophosphatase [Deltaproteobacteria bacterium]
MKFDPQPKDPELTPIDFAALKAIIHSTAAPPAPEAGSYKPACVFLLLFNPENPHVLAIQKAASDGYPWSNQVALPGGHLDADDASPLAGAYRELEEELRIRRSQVHLLGSLGHFQTINNRDIEAFAGLWNGRGHIAPDPAEIARILKIPLQLLIHTHLVRRFHNRTPDVQELRYPFRDVEVWGATARILHHFIELMFPMLENDGKRLPGPVQSD